MVGLVAALLMSCSPRGGTQPCASFAALGHSAPQVELAPAPGLAPEISTLKADVHLRVEALLRGVSLIDSQPGACALHSTFQLRPDIGSKGPVALFDLRF